MTSERVESILREGLDQRVFSAAACSLSSPGELGEAVRAEWYVGDATADTLFDLASLTKPMATATTLLRLVEIGRLALTDPVSDWLPECRHLGTASVFHLATHTCGLPAWKPLYEADDPLRAAFHTPLERLPGLGYNYSDLGYILLGVILERAGGEPLSSLCRRLVFEPLGMTRTGFLPPNHLPAAPTSNCAWREGQTLCGVPHDANATALGGVAGHAGLFATLADVASFAESLLPGAPHPVLASRGGMDNLVRNGIEGLGHQSVGFFTHGNPLLPDVQMFGASAIGHSGFTGTAMLINPDRGPAAVLLTNRVHCDPEGDRYRRFRRRLMSILAASPQPR